ncbi:unnamed protein product [Boreogadus saida]
MAKGHFNSQSGGTFFFKLWDGRRRVTRFYRCFLILFHFKGAQRGGSSLPSRTTIIQLNRRVYRNTVACTDQSTSRNLQACTSLPTTERFTPSVITSEGEALYPGRGKGCGTQDRHAVR